MARGHKEALFTDILRPLLTAHLPATLALDVTRVPLASRADLEAALLAFAQASLAGALQPDALALLRMIAADAHDGYTACQVRRRRYPIVGDGGGFGQFVHLDDVAEATIAALRRGSPGAYNITDDDPAPMREWLPEYARAIGAPPQRIPVWLARLIGGEFLVMQATAIRGASNEKAKHDLACKPIYSGWREGFRVALG